ncbi:TonB-dependent receptor plug domain-containing protein [Candidatus Zixiibacteriota bacterium]
MAWAKFSHHFASETEYTLSTNWFSTAAELGDGLYFDNIQAYARPDGNFTFDNSKLFWSGDNPHTPSGRDHEIFTDPTHGYGYITVTDTLGGTRDVVVRDEYGNVRKGRYREDVDAAFNAGGNPWDRELVVQDEFGTTYADEGYVDEDYQKRKTSSKGLRLDFSHRWNREHKLTGGFEYQYHTLRYYHHMFPHLVFRDSVVNGVWYDHGGYIDVDHYGYDNFGEESDTLSTGTAARHPYNYSLYLQDKLSLRNLAVFAGLRFDVYHANTPRLRWTGTPLGDPTDGIGDDNILDPTDFADAEAQVYLSPRLGIAYALGSKSVFHLSLGKFVQQPNLANLYSGWDFLQHRLTRTGHDAPLGSAGLEPEKATIYELGVRHAVSGFADVELTGFYKDKDDIIGITDHSIAPGAAGRDYAMYINGGWATIRGLEFQFDLHGVRGFAAQFNYALIDAEQTASRGAHRNIVWTVGHVPPVDVPHPLERPHSLSAIIDFHLDRREGFSIGDVHPLERTGLNIVLRAASGLPYSPTEIYNEITLVNLTPVPAGEVNSERAPWVYQLDLKFRKGIPLGRWFQPQQTKMTVYLEVINVFDRKNALNVYQSTGEPDNCGWLDTDAGQNWLNSDPGPDWTGLDREEKSHLKENNPLNYDTPRQIRLGMRVNF